MNNEPELLNSNSKMSDVGTITSNIDGVFNGALIGWFHIDNSNVESFLTLIVNGKQRRKARVNLPRSDVAQVLGYGENCGFCFDLMTLELDAVSHLRVEHEKSGHDFYEATYKFCPQVVHYRESIRELFFPEYYRSKYGLEMLSNDDAFLEFITKGIYEDRNPSPWFSNSYIRENYKELVSKNSLPIIAYLKNEASLIIRPSELFDLEFYRARYDDLGNVEQLLGHYTKYGRSEGRKGVDSKVPDHIVEEFKQYLEIEPALVTAADNLDNIVRYPFLTGSTYVPSLTKKKYANNIKVVICVPYITVGGADLISTHVLKAYQERYGKESVLLIVTNKSFLEVKDWIDVDTQILFLDQECSFINFEDKVDTLHRVVSLLAPEKIVNINSKECWMLYKNYGLQLATELDLFAYLFCFDYDEKNRRVGYIPAFIPDLTGVLKSVFCDNKAVIEEMQQIYGFSETDMAIFHTVYIPVADELPSRLEEESNSLGSILWAGRLARQKRPDLLLKIASAMPDQKFTVYGPAGDSPVSSDIINGKYENIEYAGVYTNISELALNDFKLILNTSQWEGLPTLLIQMSAVGMPIVTSSVGGIGELITNDTGWIVENQMDVNEYITTIRKAIIQKNITAQKAKKGITEARSTHSWSNFMHSLGEAAAFNELQESDKKKVLFFDRRGKGGRPVVNSDAVSDSSIDMFKRYDPYKSLRLVGKDGQFVPIQDGPSDDVESFNSVAR